MLETLSNDPKDSKIVGILGVISFQTRDQRESEDLIQRDCSCHGDDYCDCEGFGQPCLCEGKPTCSCDYQQCSCEDDYNTLCPSM